MERKYFFGEIIDRCSEYLDSIESSIDCYFPYAQHVALLYSILQRMNILSKGNYLFSIEILYQLIDEIFPKEKEKEKEKDSSIEQFWKDVDDNGCFYSLIN